MTDTFQILLVRLWVNGFEKDLDEDCAIKRKNSLLIAIRSIYDAFLLYRVADTAHFEALCMGTQGIPRKNFDRSESKHSGCCT
jgi:hypothetical protein